jgi:hypothetical protein
MRPFVDQSSKRDIEVIVFQLLGGPVLFLNLAGFLWIYLDPFPHGCEWDSSRMGLSSPRITAQRNSPWCRSYQAQGLILQKLLGLGKSIVEKSFWYSVSTTN